MIEILRYVPPTAYDVQYAKVVFSGSVGTISNPEWWKVTFPLKTYIKTILLINEDHLGQYPYTTSPFATVGDDPDVTKNSLCVTNVLDGGWYVCPTSLSGIIFGLYSTTDYITFMEIMAYSQEAIQMNAGVTVSFIGIEDNNGYFASNSLQQIVILKYNRSGQKCVQIAPPNGASATLSVKLKAQVSIKVVVLLPGYDTSFSNFPTFQNNVAIYGMTVGGIKQLCGVLSNYYTDYQEAPCNDVQANEIIAVQQTIANDLSFCGFGVLSDCSCAQSSFDPLQFTKIPAILFVPENTFSKTATDVPFNIKINTQNLPDTVSSVCGNGDEFTKCGLRTISFKDKKTGLPITNWPFQTFPFGYRWDEANSSLFFDPANAAATSVITVTIKLVDYPTVFWSQDISSTVSGIPIVIPTQTLNAIIGEEATLQLPITPTGVQYIVTSLPTYKATVTGSKLIVISLENKDVGTQSLQMQVKISQQTSNFIVKVIFKAKVTAVAVTKVTASPVTQVTASSVTKVTASTITKVSTIAVGTTTIENSNPTTSTITQSTVLTASDSEKLLDTAICAYDASGNMSCGSGEQKMFLDAATGQFSFVSPTKEKTTQSTQIPPPKPTLKISKVNTKGQLSFTFSEPVGLEALEKPKKTLRLLKVTQPKVQTKQKQATGDQTQLYLLSAKHLKLTIKSENTTQPHFSWHATNITSTDVLIQLVFQDPLYISNQPGLLDRLVITILPPAIQYMKSLATGTLTEDCLRTESRDLPPQVILGVAIEQAQVVSDSLKQVGQSSTVGNVVVQILLSGSMGQMWSMVNSLQIILTYQLLEVQIPGNVIMVLTNLASIADFNVFPTDDIMSFLFNFTPTDAPGVGFSAMGNDNKSLTLYLGSAFLILILIGLEYLLYSLAYACRLYDNFFRKIEQKLKPGLIFGTIYIFLIETYLDWAIGSALRLEEPKFETPSDYLDFGLACAGILITLVFPCYCFFFLKRNVDLLDKEDFKSKHGALYEGLITENALKRQASMKMPAWFLLRRFFTAVNMVYLRNQTIWMQLTINMYLSLVDVCVKIHLSPYESKLAGFIEKFNDLFVLTCAYFPYLFTDLIPQQEDKYSIGWLYSGIIGILLASNLFVMLMTAFLDVKEKISEMIKICRLKKATEAQNAKLKLQKAAMEQVQSNTIDGVVFTVVKPRMNQLQNDLQVDQKKLIEQYKAFKRLERKAKRDAEIAFKAYAEAKLMAIPELTEEEVSDIESQAKLKAARKQVSERRTRTPVEESSSSYASSSQISYEQTAQQLQEIDIQMKSQAKKNCQMTRQHQSKFYWLSEQEEKLEIAKMNRWLDEQENMNEREKVEAARKYIESAEERNDFLIIYNKHNQERAREADEERKLMIQQNQQSETKRQAQDERKRQLEKASMELNQLYEQKF